MNEKAATISARFSKPQLEILEKCQEELGLSKTDILQQAVELMGRFSLSKGAVTYPVRISSDTIKRAEGLHRKYGVKPDIDILLSEALELGVRQLRSRYQEERSEDIKLARTEMDARAIELEQDAIDM